MKILITGDFVINQPYDSSKIDQNVIDLFQQSDLNIVNLEAPVTDSNNKLFKTGPHLKSETESTLNILKILKADVLTMANNHILDYDEKGVSDTLSFCKNHNFKPIGVGETLNEALQTLYIETPEGKLAIINFAENEWSSATDTKAGAHPMDLIDNAKQIKEAKENADFVFVIVHGGQNYYDLPSPNIKKRYRFYIDLGADLVACHHSHSVSGYESYKGKNIYYGLGNFIFTKKSKKDCWYEGMFLEINIVNKQLDAFFHGISQAKEDYRLTLMMEKNGLVKFKENIQSLNRIIADDSQLIKRWNEYVKDKSDSYLLNYSILGIINNNFLRVALNKLGLNKLISHKMYRAKTLNLMRCESHRELATAILKDDIE